MSPGRGVIAGVVVLLAVAASLANPSPASAYRSPANPVQVQANWSSVWQQTVNGSYVPFPCEVANTCPPATKERLARARRLANVLPKLRAIGTLTLAGTAFSLGWKIGRVIDTQFLQLGGDIGLQPAAGTWLSNARWTFYDGSDPDSPDAGWFLTASASSCASFPTPTYYVVEGVANDNFICKDNVINDFQAFAEAATSGVSLQLKTVAGMTPQGIAEWPCTQSGYTCRGLFIPESDMEVELGANEKPVPWVSQPFGATTNIADPSTPPAWGSQTQEDVVDVFLEDEATAQANAGDPSEEETTAWEVGHAADESWEGYDLDTFVLPQPLPNETYTAYITRLQNAGYVGTVTNVELTTELDGYGPSSPARVTIPTAPGAGTTRVLDPLLWPTPGPTIAKNDPVTISRNPTTAAPVADPVAPGDGGIPSLDFTPITGIDFGCKFPYGFVCYAVDVTEWFNVTADAPVFDLGDICVTPPAVGELCAGPYVVDLDVMDAYMALLRGLMSVALWIGGVYLLAVRLLGFRAGGDPGETVDEGLNW